MMISDSALLLFNLLPRWAESVFQNCFGVSNKTGDLFCTMEGWLYYAAFAASSWFLAGMIFTRTLASIVSNVVREHHQMMFFKGGVVAIFVMACSLSMVLVGYNKYPPCCYLGSENRMRLSDISHAWAWVSFALIVPIPFLIIVVANVWLLVTVHQSHSKLARHKLHRRSNSISRRAAAAAAAAAVAASQSQNSVVPTTTASGEPHLTHSDYVIAEDSTMSTAYSPHNAQSVNRRLSAASKISMLRSTVSELSSHHVAAVHKALQRSHQKVKSWHGFPIKTLV
jgi:hypothetical protein